MLDPAQAPQQLDSGAERFRGKLLAGRDKFFASATHAPILPRSPASSPTQPLVKLMPRMETPTQAGLLSPMSLSASPVLRAAPSLPHSEEAHEHEHDGPLTPPPGSPVDDVVHIGSGAGADDGTRVSCDVCGKLYKNIGSYHNHRWEHRQGWDVTRFYAKTKKDRVELMEGAVLLMTVNSAVVAVPGDS